MSAEDRSFNLTLADGSVLRDVVIQGVGGMMDAGYLSLTQRRFAAGKQGKFAGSPGAAPGHLAVYPRGLAYRGEYDEMMATRREVSLDGLRWEVAS